MLTNKDTQNPRTDFDYKIASCFSFFVILFYSCALNYGFNAGEEIWFALHYSWQDVGAIFSRPTYHLTQSYYRPLWQLSYAVDDLIWGRNPFGYHVNSVLLLSIFVGLLFLFVSFLTNNRKVAGAAAFMFVVSPPLAFQGCYITSRGEALVGIPLLLMLMALIKINRLIFRMAMVITLLALSFFIKETSFTFLFLIILVYAYQLQFRWNTLTRRCALEFGAYFALLALFLWFRFRLLPLWGGFTSMSLGSFKDAVMNALFVNNYLSIFHEQTLRQHGLFLLYSYLFWMTATAYILKRAGRSTGFIALMMAIPVLARVISPLLIFPVSISLLYLGGVFLFIKVRAQKDSTNNHSDRLIIFSLLWIFICNLVLFTKREERLVFMASVGVVILQATLIWIAWENRKNIREKLFLASLAILIVIHISANRSIQEAMRPGSPLTQFEQLYSISRYAATPKAWDGKAIDPDTFDGVSKPLINANVIDQQGTLLVNSINLGDQAYRFLTPNKFNFYLFGYPGDLSGGNDAVLQMWRKAKLPEAFKMRYESRVAD